jgi:ATP synthase I chain
MDRLAAVFEQLALPELTRLLRRTVLAAIGVGVVALGLSVLLNHPFIGLGACVGLALGMLNVRLVSSSAAKVSARQPEKPRRVLASHTLVRLAITTAVVIGLMFASPQLGLAAAGGTAVFYFVLLANLVRALLKASATGASA